jgi:poly(A) polymerase
VGGQSDLKAGLIRCIGEADARFGEDHLRLLRAIRLAAELGFTVESVTMRAIQRRAADLARISQERVRDELIKLLRPPHAARGLRLLRESGLLPVVLPEVEACVDCRQSPEHHPEGSVWNHVVRMLELAPADGASLLPWAILLHDIGKPQTAIVDSAGGRRRFPGHERVGADLARAILERLRFPRREIDVITTCVQCHMQFMEVARMRPSTLRRILLRPTFALELELHRLDCLGSDGRLGTYQRWRDELDALATGPQLGPPLVAGSDLLALGYVSGPRLGRDLARLRDMQLQGRIHTRGEGLAVARVWLAGPVSPENSGTGDP